LLEEQVRLYSHRFEAQGLNFSAAISPHLMVEGDSTRLRQLISNLLSNSLNYTDSPGTVRLDAKVQQRQVVVVLEDSAPGVATDTLPHLFEHLLRAETVTRNRQFGAAWLGLALVQRMMQAHEASIHVEHIAMSGLVFTLQFGSLASGPY